TRCYRDWSSDVCSSDLRHLDERLALGQQVEPPLEFRGQGSGERRAGAVLLEREFMDDLAQLLEVNEPLQQRPGLLLERLVGRLRSEERRVGTEGRSRPR